MTNERSIHGLHHVTAITADAQKNIDFYCGVLGLRLVKLTVNFDDPGKLSPLLRRRTGRPGTILTFFAWAGAYRGRIGPPQVTVTAFAVPSGALDYWSKRLKEQGVKRRRALSVSVRPSSALPTPMACGWKSSALSSQRNRKANLGRTVHSRRTCYSRISWHHDFGRGVREHRHTSDGGDGFQSGWQRAEPLPLSRRHRRRVRLDGRFALRAGCPARRRWARVSSTMSRFARKTMRNRKPGTKRSPAKGSTSRRLWTEPTSTRFIIASRAACCSRSPPKIPDSPPTRRRSNWARS